MTDGLKTILDQLQEKVDKANKDAEAVISKAKAEAAQIVAAAKDEAKEQLNAAQEELKKKEAAHADRLKQATRDTLIGLREHTRTQLLNHAVADVVTRHVSDPKFVQQVVLKMCTEFVKQGAKHQDLKVLLGEDTFKRTGRELQKAVHDRIGKGVSVEALAGVKGGFQISVAGKSYVYDFSDEALAEVFSQAYGEAIDAQLFGETRQDA